MKILNETTVVDYPVGPIKVNQVAHGFAVGDVIRLDSTTYIKAQADSAENSEVVGIVGVVIDTDNFKFYLPGEKISGLTGLTAGTTYFLSASSAGAITATEPSSTGEVSKPVLITDSTTSGFVIGTRGIVNSVIDHGALGGLSDDDHTQYLLASAATNRTTFSTNWTDLTDGGATTLHTHFGLPAREVLTAARTYYVRTDGSNSNNGLSNTSGGAFLTLQKAMDVIAETLSLENFDVTVQIGDGTYTGALTLRSYQTVTGEVIFKGNPTTPTNVLLHTTSATAISSVSSAKGSFTFREFDAQTTTGGSGLLINGRNCYVKLINFGFRSCVDIQCCASMGATIEATGNLRVSGGASVGFWATRQAMIYMSLRTITYSGTVNYTARNFTSSEGSHIDAYGMTFTNGGIVTGKRYEISGNSNIFTNSGGANYLPGNSAGAASEGGIYY